MEWDKFKEYDFYFNSTNELKKVNLVRVVKYEDISEGTSLKDFIKKDRKHAILIADQPYIELEENKKFLEFLKRTDRKVFFVSPDGKRIPGEFIQDFNSIDYNLGEISGAIAYPISDSSLESGVEYTIETDEINECSFAIKNPLKITF